MERVKCFTKSVAIRMGEADVSKLSMLSHVLNIPQGEVVRQLLRMAHVTPQRQVRLVLTSDSHLDPAPG